MVTMFYGLVTLIVVGVCWGSACIVHWSLSDDGVDFIDD
jgi:hypothetical protein